MLLVRPACERTGVVIVPHGELSGWCLFARLESDEFTVLNFFRTCPVNVRTYATYMFIHVRFFFFCWDEVRVLVLHRIPNLWVLLLLVFFVA